MILYGTVYPFDPTMYPVTNTVFWTFILLILFNTIMWILYIGLGGHDVIIPGWPLSTCDIVSRNCTTNNVLIIGATTPLCNATVYDHIYDCSCTYSSGPCYVNPQCTLFSANSNEQIEYYHDPYVMLILMGVTVLSCLGFVGILCVKQYQRNKEIERMALLEQQINRL